MKPGFFANYATISLPTHSANIRTLARDNCHLPTYVRNDAIRTSKEPTKKMSASLVVI